MTIWADKPKSNSIHHAPQALIDWMYRDYSPVWVLSTGRAGSNFLAGVLKQSGNLLAHHEAEPRLEYFANYAFHHQDQTEKLRAMVEVARMELVLEACVQDKIYVECNHALTAFAPVLSGLFQRSRFVHLVRHPGDFIRSAIRMGFHASDTIWESGRIRLQDASVWNGMSLVEKLAWYWQANNQFIQDFGASLGEGRFLVLAYEELVDGVRGIHRLLDFIGGEPLDPEQVRALQARKVNTVGLDAAVDTLNRTPHYPAFPCWKEALVRQMLPYVEELCQRLGYPLPAPQALEQPLLTVVVPNYNGAAYLEACLRSILDQTYPHLEILVVDDASSDGSLEILHRYAALHPQRLRVIALSRNVGVCQARNQAIEEARGTYLTTLDCDDYLIDREKLEREVALVMLHKARSGEDVIAFSDILLADAEGNLRGSQFGEEMLREGSLLPGILTRSIFIPRDFVALRSAYRECGGYDARFSTHEDWNLKIKLAARHKFFYTGLAGVAYRRHGQGLSSAPYWKRVENLCQVFAENLALFFPDPAAHESLRAGFAAHMEKVQRFEISRLEPKGMQPKGFEPTSLVDMFRSAAEERLEVIHGLEKTCQERLDLIHMLESVCVERQAVIERLNAALQKPSRRRFW